ncbi:hypothetical protein ES703_113253 [subsurface metagenome]
MVSISSLVIPPPWSPLPYKHSCGNFFKLLRLFIFPSMQAAEPSVVYTNLELACGL